MGTEQGWMEREEEEEEEAFPPVSRAVPGSAQGLFSLFTALPRSVASLCTETLPLLAVTFITENSLVAAVSPGWL